MKTTRTLTLLLAALMAYPTVQHLLENDGLLIGQNYSVITDLLPGTSEAD